MAIVTIEDNEEVVAGFELDADVYGTPEGGSVVVTVTRPSATAVAQVTIATTNKSATAGSDYVATTKTLTFGAGVTSLTSTLTILSDSGNPVDEGDEHFNVTLSNPSAGSRLGRARAPLVILDDDTN
jgi:hypothetical protein